MRFRSPLLTQSSFLSLPRATEMFHFARFALPLLCIHKGVLSLQLRGLPHSDICGSTLVCNSPQLFAAYHVLHRLSMPRHPPHALSSLTKNSPLCQSHLTITLTQNNPRRLDQSDPYANQLSFSQRTPRLSKNQEANKTTQSLSSRNSTHTMFPIVKEQVLPTDNPLSAKLA